MRKCRHFHRLLLKHSAFLKTTLKLTFILCAIATLFLYFQEKKEKETLIHLALGRANTEELVQPDKDTSVLNGYSERTGREKVNNAFVVIVVTSSLENEARRNIIRNSWGKQAREFGVVVVFFLGIPNSDELMGQLTKENKQFRDILIDDFHESYYALAVKTLRVFKYFKFHHSKSKFLVKTDDDVYVSVPNVVRYCFAENERFIMENVNRDYFVGGVIHSGRGPHTWNSFSKWYAPADVWGKVYNKAVKLMMNDKYDPLISTDGSINENSYPSYAEGNFYILSDDTVADILNVSTKVPLYHLEDVFVTGVLANWILKIEQVQVPFISSASNMFPRWSYFWFKLFVDPSKILAFHCDNNVELIKDLFEDSRA